jgi:hypothetical protein
VRRVSTEQALGGEEDTRRWREALEAARYIHQISPGESILAAFAAFELKREAEARALFPHAVLNKPRTVGGLLGVRFVRPRDREESEDHNDGVGLARALDDFLRQRRLASSARHTCSGYLGSGRQDLNEP